MNHIEKLAKEIIVTLKSNGYVAYYAGGYVRDMLLGNHSCECDIDIATDALPEEIAHLFTDHHLVGAQFGVCVVRHKGHSFEVATFRQDVGYDDGRRPASVLLKSSPEEDAQRRDFTVNGMFYDPIANEIYDFVGGKEDLKVGVIRTIGKAEDRFEEDRLRMIRAVRFAYRLGYYIENETKIAIKARSHTILDHVSKERIWQELQKICQGPNFDSALVEMSSLGLLGAIFKPLANTLPEEISSRLDGLQSITESIPPILILTELFTPADNNYTRNLGVYLKAAKEETKWIETLLEIKTLWQLDPAFTRRFDWAHALANSRSKACLEVIFCKLLPSQRESSIQALAACKKALQLHIDRIQKRHPLLQAQDLIEEGINPGVRMGKLLRQAERLAIEYDLQTTQQVLKKLTSDTLWTAP